MSCEGKFIVHLKDKDLQYDIFYRSQKMLFEKTLCILEEHKNNLIGYELKVKIS